MGLDSLPVTIVVMPLTEQIVGGVMAINDVAGFEFTSNTSGTACTRHHTEQNRPEVYSDQR